MTTLENELYRELMDRTDLSEFRHLLRKVVNQLQKEQTPPYWNPYGFLVWKLQSFDDGTALRLHVWPHDGRIVQHPIFPLHAHPWTLQSLVVSGSVTTENYEVNTDSESASHSIYEVGYRDGASVLERTDKTATPELVEEQEVKRGEYYDIDAHLAHSATIDEHSFASTLVLTEEVSDSQAQVLVQNAHSNEYHFKRYSPDAHRVEKLLGRLKQEL